MSPNLGVLCEPPPTLDFEPEVRASTPSLLLIRVPALAAPPRPERPQDLASYRRARLGRRRRRLRREVRVAALALSFSVPMIALLLRFWPSAPAAIDPWPMPDAPRSVAFSAPSEPDPGPQALRPLVSISLEPASGDRISDFEVPEVRPAGFLLPDDGSEEPAHAGG